MSGHSFSLDHEYETQDKNWIANLPIKDICEKDCVLFLWVTNPMLQEGLETIKRWGFAYKTVGFSWYKKNKKADSFFYGLGYYSRAKDRKSTRLNSSH